MAGRLNKPLELASDELARLGSQLAFVDSVGPKSPGHIRDHAAALRAFAYVWLAAILERFVKDTLSDVLREINAVEIPSAKLRVSLYALLCESDLESIGSQSRQKTWERRIEMFARVRAESPNALFDAQILPLDGRTIRLGHLQEVWKVFGFPGEPVPHPRHGLALKELADDRNDVAHGSKPAVEFGRKKAAADVQRLLSMIEDIILHINMTAEEYLERRQYMHEVPVSICGIFAALAKI